MESTTREELRKNCHEAVGLIAMPVALMAFIFEKGLEDEFEQWYDDNSTEIEQIIMSNGK